MKEKKRSVRWGLKDWRGVAWVVIGLGGILGAIAGLAYFGGMPEHVREYFDGSSYSPKRPPGNPIVGGMAVVGLVILSIGLLGYAVTSIMIRRAKE